MRRGPQGGPAPQLSEPFLQSSQTRALWGSTLSPMTRLVVAAAVWASLVAPRTYPSISQSASVARETASKMSGAEVEDKQIFRVAWALQRVAALLRFSRCSFLRSNLWLQPGFLLVQP